MYNNIILYIYRISKIKLIQKMSNLSKVSIVHTLDSCYTHIILKVTIDCIQLMCIQ